MSRAFTTVRQRTREQFYSLWDGWRLREKRKPSRWATEERRLAQGGPMAKGEDIPYKHSVMPHMVEPMDMADDPETNIIVLWMGRRMAKTEGGCMNIIGRTVTDAPTNIMSFWPVQDSAERFSRDVLETTIEATPALRTRFVEKKSRDSGRTIWYKRFHGGSIIISFAGSKSQTRGMAAGVVMAHEADAYPVSSQGEGDPIEKLFGRAEGFDEAIKIVESTGTIAAEIDPKNGKKIYRSNIEKWFDRGDQRKWFCPCRKCGHLQWLKWEQIKYPKGEPEKAEYVCEKCETGHNEKQWRRMVSDGRWMPTAPFKNGIRSYWINGFNSLLPKGKGFKTKLHQFASEGERALNGTPEERRVWINEVKCELASPDEETEDPPAWKPLFERRENYGLIVPAKASFLTCFVDCQLNRLEVAWRAFGRNEESWGIDHVTLEGHIRDKEVWQALRRELVRRFEHESGAEIRLGFGLIDGGHYAEYVYAFFRELARNPLPGVNGKFRASKGVGQHGHPIITRKMMTVAKVLKGHHIGTWEAKDRIYERLRMEIEDNITPEGWMHFNELFSEEYFQQLTSEKVTVTFEKGVEVRKYEKAINGAANEGLDLEVGCLAAYRLFPRSFDHLEAALAEAAALKKEAVKPKPKAAPQAPYVPPRIASIRGGY